MAMTTVYLLRRGVKAKKDGRRISITFNEEKVDSVPISDVMSVVLGAGAHISTPLMEVLMEEDIPVYFIDFYGNIKGQLCGENTSWFRSKCQMERFINKDSQLELVKWLVREKLENQRKLLKYYARQKQDLEIGQYANDIKYYIRELEQVTDIDVFRGVEGMAARMYFSAYELILENTEWVWKGRSRRPALDPANALLNYAYAFLEREVRTAIVGAGLDPRFGFFHSNNGRKDSLVFDLMELFRQPVIDRLVLSSMNHKQLSPNEFEYDGDGGWRVGDDARQDWIKIYEDYMEKSYQEYNGLTSRKWIRRKIREFALMVFRSGAEAA